MPDKNLSGYYLLKEPHLSFEPSSVQNPVVPKGSLLRYSGTFPYDGDSGAPFCEHKPSKGDHIFTVESEGDDWAFQVPLNQDEIERFVEPVKIKVVHWVSDTKNREITISWDFCGRREFFQTGRDLARKLNGILKEQGVLIDSALVWCLDLPWKEGPCKFYPKGSKLENYE